MDVMIATHVKHSLNRGNLVISVRVRDVPLYYLRSVKGTAITRKTGKMETSKFEEEQPNEAALLVEALNVLREIREDLAADGEISDATLAMLNAVLLVA